MLLFPQMPKVINERTAPLVRPIGTLVPVPVA
jgi:hypothetical protein